MLNKSTPERFQLDQDHTEPKAGGSVHTEPEENLKVLDSGLVFVTGSVH